MLFRSYSFDNFQQFPIDGSFSSSQGTTQNQTQVGQIASVISATYGAGKGYTNPEKTLATVQSWLNNSGAII